MDRYRKKPEIYEAEQFITEGKTLEEVKAIAKRLGVIVDGPSNVAGLMSYYIMTSGGIVSVSPGDWIMKGPAGEQCVPVSPKYFEARFEKTCGKKHLEFEGTLEEFSENCDGPDGGKINPDVYIGLVDCDRHNIAMPMWARETNMRFRVTLEEIASG